MNEYYTCILRALKADNLYRRLRDVKVIDSSKAIVDGKEVILLCSNDYLGLSCSKEVKNQKNKKKPKGNKRCNKT
jgi:7-keto-8-aminopelargonate synthetase-like enzyme